ncbi:MAG: 30S ribosomal protein S6 [Phycisphaerales bacterium]
MPPTRTYTYEAMFLIGQAAAADLASAVEHIKEVLSRAHAEVIAMSKWDERRLAYEIKKQKRGLYILTYFTAPNTSLKQIERDCNLSEKVLRVLILRADHYTMDEMQAKDGREALDTEAKMRASRPADAPLPREQAHETVPPAAEAETGEEMEE